MKYRTFLHLLISVVVVCLNATSAELPKIGDKAPAVEAKDQDGHLWKLADLQGKQAVIVYFYPKDDTPGCTKEACGFRDRIEELSRLGVAVVGVSRDDAESHKAFRAKHQLNFPLLVDTDGKVTEAFGAAAPDRPRSRRVSFLVGKDGRIRHVTDSRDAQVHLDELKTAVGKLKD